MGFVPSSREWHRRKSWVPTVKGYISGRRGGEIPRTHSYKTDSTTCSTIDECSRKRENAYGTQSKRVAFPLATMNEILLES